MAPRDFEERRAEQRRNARQRQEHERQHRDRFHRVTVLFEHLAVSLRGEIERQADHVRYPFVEAGEAELCGLEGGFVVLEVGYCCGAQVRCRRRCVAWAVFLEMRRDHFHLEHGGRRRFAHVDAVFGDLVQRGEVGGFYVCVGRGRSSRRRLLPSAV